MILVSEKKFRKEIINLRREISSLRTELREQTMMAVEPWPKWKNITDSYFFNTDQRRKEDIKTILSMLIKHLGLELAKQDEVPEKTIIKKRAEEK